MAKKYAFGGQAAAGMARRPVDPSAAGMANRPTANPAASRAAPQAMQNAAAQSRLMRPTAMAAGGGVKRELSDFEQAFAENRRKLGAGKTFDYKGKKYSTNRADDKPAKSEAKKDEAKSESPKPSRARYEYDDVAMRGNRAALERASRGGTTKREDDPAPLRRQREQDAKTTAGLAAATMGPLAAVGTAGSLGTMGRAARVARGATQSAREFAEERLKEPIQKVIKRQGVGYAKGGMVRGDGCATKGKTKGRMV